MPRERQLFVAGLTSGCPEELLKSVFESFGTVDTCSVATDTKGKTIGFVTFRNIQHARAAEMMNGLTTGGMGPLVVVPALSRAEK
eukprot:gene1809-2761_t